MMSASAGGAAQSALASRAARQSPAMMPVRNMKASLLIGQWQCDGHWRSGQVAWVGNVVKVAFWVGRTAWYELVLEPPRLWGGLVGGGRGGGAWVGRA